MNTKTLVICSVLALPTMLVGCGSMTPRQEEMVLTGVQTATMAYIIKGGADTDLTKRAVRVVELATAVSAHVATIASTITVETVAAYANTYIQGRKDLSQQDKGLANFVIAKALEAAAGYSVEGLNAVLTARIQTALGEIARVAVGFIPPPRILG